MNTKTPQTILIQAQENLDKIPEDYEGQIEICGDCSVEKKYKKPVKIWGLCKVELKNNAVAIASDNSQVYAFDNSFVFAKKNSYVWAHDNSRVDACDNSAIHALDNSVVSAGDSSMVYAENNSRVFAINHADVWASGNSKVITTSDGVVSASNHSEVEAFRNSCVIAYSDSQIYSYDTVKVFAHKYSTINAYGSSLVSLCGEKVNVFLHADAHIAAKSKTIQEFADFYNLKIKDNKIILYKAAYKTSNGEYYSDYDHTLSFKIGEIVKKDCDMNPENISARGLYVSTFAEAATSARKENWVVLELEIDIDKIVVPIRDCIHSALTTRTSEALVLREVSLEDMPRRED